MRPLDISVGAPHPKTARNGFHGVSRSICDRTMAWRKLAACCGSSKVRNTKRRLARTSSICAPRKSRRSFRAGLFDDLPFDKTQSGPDGAPGRPPSRWFDSEGKILLLDEPEFSCRPDDAGDRDDRKRHVIDPARQQHRQSTQEVHSLLSLLLNLEFSIPINVWPPPKHLVAQDIPHAL